MHRDGKISFIIHGVYIMGNMDFRPKLVELLSEPIGYDFCDFDLSRNVLKVPENIPFGDEYHLFVATPAEDPLMVVTELFDELGGSTATEKFLFTYLPTIRGAEFEKNQIDCLDKVGATVEKFGGKFFKCNSIEMLAGFINGIGLMEEKKK